jgi:hypothetical protein
MANSLGTAIAARLLPRRFLLDACYNPGMSDELRG